MLSAGQHAEAHITAIGTYPLVFFFDTQAVARANVPVPSGDWQQLLDAAYRGQIVTPHSATSGAAYSAIATILQTAIQGGGTEEDGRAFVGAQSQDVAKFSAGAPRRGARLRGPRRELSPRHAILGGSHRPARRFTMPTIHDHAQALAERTVALRRDLHQHPEIAFQEVRTMGVVAERLRALGLAPRTGVGRTGVIAVWDSGRPGPTVLARADMDALPVADEKDAPYRSRRDGWMHACGHDGHTAVLLSVSEVLLARGDELRGRVVFVFQPAEEIVRGAEAMLADGALDDIEVDHAIGLHLSSTDPTGVVAVRTGPAMAATDSFRLAVQGRGGHAAKPNEAVDPVVVAAHLVLALQALVSRETDPVDPAVISVTSVHGGTAFNIIPESVELKGTLRTFDGDTRARLRRRILEVADAVATTFRATVAHAWTEGSPVVVNDDEATGRLRAVAARIVGAERVVTGAQIMGGDDMALWLGRAPGCYFFVGARGGDASAWPHHHPRFDIDEAALPIAVEVLASAVVDLLQG